MIALIEDCLDPLQLLGADLPQNVLYAGVGSQARFVGLAQFAAGTGLWRIVGAGAVDLYQ
ncbi:hypothetical protein D3C76_1023710 [compost metagenome]